MGDDRPGGSIPLGYGTGHLMGRIGWRESIRLIHAALDSGVVHFDTARVYGLGDAERMLGAALRNRSGVSVYTKVGQGRPEFSRTRSLLNSALRPAARLRASLGSMGSALPSYQFVRRTDFRLESVRRSVETSLRQLRREALDAVLLHEVTIQDLSPELLELLDGLVHAGKILKYGIASEYESLESILANGDATWHVVQQAGGPWTNSLRVPAESESVMHSIFGARGYGLRRFMDWLAAEESRRRAMEEVRSTESFPDIAGLLLRHTAQANPGARLLVSSSSPQRIRTNASAAAQGLSQQGCAVVDEVLESFRAQARDQSPDS